MRAAIFVLLAACELVPAPKQQAAAGSAAPAAAAAPAQAPAAAPQAPVPDDACTQVGVRWAEAYIADAHDPQQKAMLEQERTEIVRRIQQGCRDQKWNDDVRNCMLAGKSIQDLQACAKMLQPAQPAQAPAPAPAPEAAAKAPEPAKPAEAKPVAAGQPDTKKAVDTKKPADAKKPADVKKPADAKKPADVKTKKPADAKKPADPKP